MVHNPPTGDDMYQILWQPDHDPPPAWHQRAADLGPDHPAKPGWWCSGCHVVHVSYDRCPVTGLGKDGQR